MSVDLPDLPVAVHPEVFTWWTMHDCRRFLSKALFLTVTLCPVCGRQWSTPIVKQGVKA